MEHTAGARGPTILKRGPGEPLFTTGNPEERSGLGFSVMQSFMDNVRVTSRPGRGTRVTLTKRLSPRR